MKSKTLLMLVVAVVCLLVIAGFVHALSSGVPVEAARVTKGPIREFVDERAITRLPRTYLITMPANGRIEEITMHEGMAVAAGQVVARIVERDLELTVQQADAAHKALQERVHENADNTVEETGYQQTEKFVESMAATAKAAASRMDAGKAKLDYAETNAANIRKAVGGGAYSRDDLLRAELRQTEAAVDYRQDILVHEAMVAMQKATFLMPTMVRQYIDRKRLTGNVLVEQKAEAKARLEQVRQDQLRGTMRSPVDGVVLNRYVSNERFLTAGQSLLEIGRLEDLEVEADVLSLDVVEAKVGDPVEIYGPAIGEPAARGTVARVFPAGFTKVSSLGVEQQRVKVIIHLDRKDLMRLLEQRRLGVGYRVRVRIFTAEKPTARIIPRSALFRGKGDQWQVYAIRNGRAEIREVKVGLINDEAVEVTAALDDGEQVVLAPESNLADGARVEVREAEKESKAGPPTE